MSELSEIGMSRTNDLLPHLPFKRTTLRKLINEGKFPAPKKIGCMTCFKNAEVLQWLREQGNQAADSGGVKS